MACSAVRGQLGELADIPALLEQEAARRRMAKKRCLTLDEKSSSVAGAVALQAVR
jgi:hypothetical protein